MKPYGPLETNLDIFLFFWEVWILKIARTSVSNWIYYCGLNSGISMVGFPGPT